MREITSPFGNPERKWAFVDSYHLRVRVSGSDCHLESTKIKDGGWIGTTEVYVLDRSEEESEGESLIVTPKTPGTIVCHVFKLFGDQPAIQHWGFAEDVGSEQEQEAVCFDGKWFLLEGDDRFELDIQQKIGPFKGITLTVRSKSDVKSQTYKRPPE